MLAPADPDPEIATALLDIATRPWPHGADATLAQLEVLRARGVPLEANNTPIQGLEFFG